MGTWERLPFGFYKDIFYSVLPYERYPLCCFSSSDWEYIIEWIIAKEFHFFLVRWKGRRHLGAKGTSTIWHTLQIREPSATHRLCRCHLCATWPWWSRDVHHDAIQCLFPNIPSQLRLTFSATKNTLLAHDFCHIWSIFFILHQKEFKFILPVQLQVCPHCHAQFFNNGAPPPAKKKGAVECLRETSGSASLTKQQQRASFSLTKSWQDSGELSKPHLLWFDYAVWDGYGLVLLWL